MLLQAINWNLYSSLTQVAEFEGTKVICCQFCWYNFDWWKNFQNLIPSFANSNQIKSQTRSTSSKILFTTQNMLLILSTLDSGINVGVCLLIFGLSSSGYVLIKGGTFIKFSIFYLLNIFFYFFFFSYV